MCQRVRRSDGSKVTGSEGHKVRVCVRIPEGQSVRGQRGRGAEGRGQGAEGAAHHFHLVRVRVRVRQLVKSFVVNHNIG